MGLLTHLLIGTHLLPSVVHKGDIYLHRLSLVQEILEQPIY